MLLALAPGGAWCLASLSPSVPSADLMSLFSREALWAVCLLLRTFLGVHCPSSRPSLAPVPSADRALSRSGTLLKRLRQPLSPPPGLQVPLAVLYHSWPESASSSWTSAEGGTAPPPCLEPPAYSPGEVSGAEVPPQQDWGTAQSAPQSEAERRDLGRQVLGVGLMKKDEQQ